MYSKTIHSSILEIPQGMNRLPVHHSDAIEGGKRREGAFLGRAIIGMIGGMIVPGGFIIAFF